MQKFLEKLLCSIADDETTRSLFDNWIDQKVNKRFEEANKALDSLLADRKRHPITYNHYYTETLQKIRQERQAKELEKKIQAFLRTDRDTISLLNSPSQSIHELAESLSTQSERDMDSFACSELLDSMQAYYKVNPCTSCKLHLNLITRSRWH